MIQPISMAQVSKKVINSKKIARNVVKGSELPSGLTKTPIRCMDDGELKEVLKFGLGVCLGTSALSCMSEFAQGCTIGSNMV